MEQELIGLRRELLNVEDATGVHPDVDFRVIGVGPDRSGATLAQILQQNDFYVDGVLVLGVAGGIDPELETGDLLLADRYALQNGAAQHSGKAIHPDSAMLRTGQQAALNLSVPIFEGGSLTVDHLVAQPQERQALRVQYQVRSVNMEDYPAAEAAREKGVPFLSVRVVLDTANQSLPGYLPGLAKSPYKVITNVLLMPWRIPTMLGLKKQLQLCQAVLTNFGMSYLRVAGIVGTGR